MTAKIRTRLHLQGARVKNKILRKNQKMRTTIAINFKLPSTLVVIVSSQLECWSFFFFHSRRVCVCRETSFSVQPADVIIIYNNLHFHSSPGMFRTLQKGTKNVYISTYG